MPEGFRISQLIMPIYEFHCPENNTTYSFLAKSLSYGDKIPRCPDNPAYTMRRCVSGFAFIGKAKEPSEDGMPDGADDDKMERVMAELERDMSDFDESNPDPRQMARLMRKMADMTGERLPGSMEEMVRRLEAGEDPEKLEEEYGDALEGEEGEFGGIDAEGESGAAAQLRRLRQRMRPAKRDPQLYDFADFV